MIRKSTNPTERSAIWAPMSRVAALILLLVAGTAHAGVPRVSQIHPFKVSGSIFVQGVNEKTGDDILEKEKFTEKSFGASCLMQEKLEKSQAVVLMFNDACEDINDNEIQVITTEPPSTTTIGEMHFTVDSQIVTERKGVNHTLTVPALVELDCIGAANVDVIANATATIKLINEGLCLGVGSIKLKNGSGGGVIDDVDVILDGVKANAKKPLD